ncbi:MAG TPA: class I SAM-dependent methyltransferase [Thermoleophilaceae bacterium]|nr:class I SAM-dependent methyltransferase [Thermoleophilaceae bacterium]
MGSRYEDELWELVPERTRGPRVLRDWVAALAPARHALDIGCGDGVLSAAIPTEQLTLADVSAVALERARRRLPEAAAVEVEPDAPLPFADSAFDLVVCTEALEHVHDLQLFLSEARRVLAPGGRLAVTTPAHRAWMRTPDPLSPHLRFLTRRTLGTLLDRMGFDVVELRRRGSGLFAVASR